MNLSQANLLVAMDKIIDNVSMDKSKWHVTGNIHTHTHPFNGPFSGTTQVSRYQKGKTNLDFTEARDSEWQWHQLGHMQLKVCTSLQQITTPAPHHSVFTGRMTFLPPNQQRQSTEGFFTKTLIHHPSSYVNLY